MAPPLALPIQPRACGHEAWGGRARGQSNLRDWGHARTKGDLGQVPEGTIEGLNLVAVWLTDNPSSTARTIQLVGTGLRSHPEDKPENRVCGQIFALTGARVSIDNARTAARTGPNYQQLAGTASAS